MNALLQVSLSSLLPKPYLTPIRPLSDERPPPGTHAEGVRGAHTAAGVGGGPLGAVQYGSSADGWLSCGHDCGASEGRRGKQANAQKPPQVDGETYPEKKRRVTASRKATCTWQAGLGLGLGLGLEDVHASTKTRRNKTAKNSGPVFWYLEVQYSATNQLVNAYFTHIMRNVSASTTYCHPPVHTTR